VLKRFLWNYAIRRLARRHNFIDPIFLLQRLSRFAQPSEVMAPTELLRATALLHARGLLNAQVIQHNLDWVWPYWVKKQFNPNDISFIPRAFSLTHINLTHRNWTAVGLSSSESTPIVDPRGLVTPFWDSWSLDFWVVGPGRSLLPSELGDVKQEISLHDNLSVTTEGSRENKRVVLNTQVISNENGLFCDIKARAFSQDGGFLVIALRPFNPEGVSFIESIEFSKGDNIWLVNGKEKVFLEGGFQGQVMSTYERGDVYHFLGSVREETKVQCSVGMATAACLYAIKPGGEATAGVKVLLEKHEKNHRNNHSTNFDPGENWREKTNKLCSCSIKDQHYENLYTAALRTLFLHSAGQVYAGPYTYRRFWFRDAVFISYALLCAGAYERVSRIIEQFLQRQTVFGYFQSQEGEWDSNGQVLWLLQQYCLYSGKKLPQHWKGRVKKAAAWIIGKRSKRAQGTSHQGLMPAGFSAEHLGPNDYYYWDNFWSAQGLESASYLMDIFEESAESKHYMEVSEALKEAIKDSLISVRDRLGKKIMPASPYRRMDSGAIGSLVCGYPLRLSPPDDQTLLATADYLADNCLVDNGFFHDMSHSGINPYLTLHIAQVFLRAGDLRFCALMEAIAGLASSTYQWPEAIHPRTKGGCMGDGQHVWAASEWMMMMRNCFVREEGQGLILCSGVDPEWVDEKTPLHFGPAPTPFGEITLSIQRQGEGLSLEFDGLWRKSPPPIEVRLRGFQPLHWKGGEKDRFILFKQAKKK
jgi:hypothetical protein